MNDLSPHADAIARDQRYRERARSGTLIVYLQRFLSAAVNIAQMVVLSRLLTPAEFGVAAIVLVIYNFMTIMRDLGLSSATIQVDSLGAERRAALFWFNAAVTGAGAILIVATAPLLAAAFRAPLVPMLWVLALAFLVVGLASQHAASLRREIAFRPVAVAEIAGLLCGVTLTIGLAIHGAGAWSLVWGTVLQGCVTGALYWISAGWMPGWPRALRSHLHLVWFGAGASAFQLLNYLAYNLPTAAIGYLYDPAAMGQFSRAQSLLMFPLTFLLTPFMAVQFPLLCRFATQPEATIALSRRILTLTCAAFLPIGLIASLGAADIVAFLFGPQWDRAAVMVACLGPAIASFGILGPFSHFMISQGRVRELGLWGMFDFAARGGSAALGALHSPEAAAAAFGFVSFVVCAPLSLVVSGRRGPVTTRLQLSAIAQSLPVVAASGATAVAAALAVDRLQIGIVPVDLALLVVPTAAVWIVTVLTDRRVRVLLLAGERSP